MKTKKLDTPSLINSCLLMLLSASSQLAVADEPWFGINMPPAFEAHLAPVLTGARSPVPALVPSSEAGFNELQGSRIYADLEKIVAFSFASRRSRELGGDQLWGRVSGFPSGDAVVNWAAEQLRAAGISEVRSQQFSQESGSQLWLPQAWEVRLLASEKFGLGSTDVVLETAMALGGSEIEGELQAPLVYVGTASPAQLAHIDVQGKIAVQKVIPQAHLVFERGRAVPRAQDLIARGAVAVVNIIEQPGNERARDFSNCGGPCFNLGGQDSHFLESVMNAAAEAGQLNELQLQISLQSVQHENLSAGNALAVIPGAGENSMETIVINAHADAWFDGAGDNGDGLAVLLALARHFVQPQHQLRRTLVLVVSAGHHTPGLNGPRNAVRMNSDLFANSLLIVNLEHVAQRNITPARSVSADGYREFVADSGEAPIVAGITIQSAFLEELFVQGIQRYGTNFVSASNSMASGEGGGYRSAEVPIVTTMQAPPLYHTSGEVLEMISVPGLERMARFMAFFVKQVDNAARNQLAP